MKGIICLAMLLECVMSFNILDSSRYLPLKEQHKFLKKLNKLAGGNMKLKVIGNTHIDGKDYANDIHLVTFGSNPDHIIFFDCGMHAREWISSATCLYLIQKLATLFSNKKSKSPLLHYQWQFIPMANPDGYEISHKGDRMQRKNARPYATMALTKEQIRACRCVRNPENCNGVDLNRNFPAGWGLGNKMFEASSDKPCKSVYKGSHPLSEPETYTLDKHISSLKDRIIGAFSIHCYGEDIYYPKGWLRADAADQIKGAPIHRLVEFAQAFNKELKFGIGSVWDLLGYNELQGGATDDYYYTSKDINITYTIELSPGMDDAHIGFELPPEEIKKVGAKMWRALGFMADKFDYLYPEAKNHRVSRIQRNSGIRSSQFVFEPIKSPARNLQDVLKYVDSLNGL